MEEEIFKLKDNKLANGEVFRSLKNGNYYVHYTSTRIELISPLKKVLDSKEIEELSTHNLTYVWADVEK